MKKLIATNRYFLLPYLFFLIICGILLAVYSKPELHIISNKNYSHFFDHFFKYATWLGNGAWIAVLFLVLLFVKFRFAFAFLAGSLLAALIVNLFKKVLLHNMYRPAKYFELFETYKLHLVEGVKTHSLQSFPSGHTATAFSLFFMLALITKNNSLKLMFFLIAVVVAYSRVYLSQHFMMDITAGSVTGVVFTFAAFVWFGKLNKTWLENSILRKYK